MENIRTRYYNLTDPERTMVMLAALAVASAVMYLLILTPMVKTWKNAKTELKRTGDTVYLLDTQLKKLKALGHANTHIGPEQIEQLRAGGNDAVFESQMRGFLDMLGGLNAKSGGKDFKLEEGNPGRAYVGVGPRKDVFDVMRLPVTITFKSDYSAASNYIFQLRELKKMVRIDDVVVESGSYTTMAPLKVRIEMGVYYLEGF
jgi:hypothetical protein